MLPISEPSTQPDYPPQWILHEVRRGFQALLCLSLESTPAHDVIQGTLLLWARIIAQRGAWDSATDTERFRQAFMTLASTCTRWPAPRAFFEAIPRPTYRPPARERSPADQARAREAGRVKLAELLAKLGMGPQPAAHANGEPENL